jgi:uncharacterized membrane protein (GlpM family)
MLALKLLLVPSFLALITLVGRRWGPSVSGWLAGFPFVAGPILLLIAIERGAAFAATSASAALGAVVASLAYMLAYAWTSRRRRWHVACLAGLLAWFVAVALLRLMLVLPWDPWPSLVVALVGLRWIVPRFPPVQQVTIGARLPSYELPVRMAAGALLTVIVTGVSAHIGPAWSGLVTIFPVLSMVLAVFSHRAHGAAYVGAMLRSMAVGLWGLLAFCLALALLLPRLSMTWSFVIATVLAIVAQLAVRRR